MAELKKIGLHSIYLLLGNIIIAVLSFGITIFITRKLGPTDYGIYSYVLSIFLFLSPIALLGLSSILQRSTSFYYGKKDFGRIKGYTITISKIVFYSTTAIALTTAIISLAFPTFLRYTGFILLTLPFFFFVTFYTLFASGFVSGTRKFGVAVFLDVLSKVLLLSMLFFLVTYGITGIIVANTVSVFLPLLILIFILSKFFSEVKTKEVGTKSALSLSLQFFIAQIIFGVLLYMNIFVLTYFAPQYGIEQAGFYTLATNIEFYSENFLMFIGSALTPAIIQYYGEKNSRRLNQAVNLGFKYTFLLVFPVLFSFVSAADVIVHDIFSKTYTSTIPVLQILAFTLLSTMLLRMLLPIVLAKKLMKEYLYLAVLILLVMLPASFILTSRFSAYGAAIARVVPMIAGTFLFTFVVVKKAKIPFPLKTLVAEFLLSTIFLSLFLVPRNLLAIALSFIGLLAVYLGLLFVTRILDRNDVRRVAAFITSIANSKL